MIDAERKVFSDTQNQRLTLARGMEKLSAGVPVVIRLHEQLLDPKQRWGKDAKPWLRTHEGDFLQVWVNSTKGYINLYNHFMNAGRPEILKNIFIEAKGHIMPHAEFHVADDPEKILKLSKEFKDKAARKAMQTYKSHGVKHFKQDKPRFMVLNLTENSRDQDNPRDALYGTQIDHPEKKNKFIISNLPIGASLENARGQLQDAHAIALIGRPARAGKNIRRFPKETQWLHLSWAVANPSVSLALEPALIEPPIEVKKPMVFDIKTKPDGNSGNVSPVFPIGEHGQIRMAL